MVNQKEKEYTYSNKNAYEIGRDLMNSTKDSIHRLHELLDENDIQLTSIADNLGLTILRYGIEYYNNNSDNEKKYTYF